jgi:hypothetical protein
MYVKLLRILGLRGLIGELATPTVNVELPTVIIRIDPESGDVEQNIDNSEKSVLIRYFRFPLNLAYFLFVIGLLMWPCIYSIYVAIKLKDVRYLTINIFKILFFLQYITGIYYFQQNHFVNMIHSLNRGEKYINVAFYANIFFSIVLSIISVIFLATDIDMNIYSHLYKDTTIVRKIFICALVFFTQFYSFSIFFSNSIIFSATFINHQVKISEYVSKLADVVQIRNMTIMNIVDDFSFLKGHYKNSVTKLNFMFSSTLVMGYLSAYFVVRYFNSGFVIAFNYIELSCVCISVGSYLLSINHVMSKVDDIKEIIRSSQFSAIYLDRQQFSELHGNGMGGNASMSPSRDSIDLNKTADNMDMVDRMGMYNNIKFIRDLVFISNVRDQENGSSVDWGTLNTLLSDSWESFKILSYEIDAPKIITKSLGIIILFVTGVGFGQTIGILSE